MPSFSTDPFQYLRRRAVGLMGGGGGSTPVVYDPDAAAYFAAMSVQPDDARKSLINDLIVGLKADGVWSKLDLFYLLALGTQQAANLNAKTPASFTVTPAGTTTFTADRGYTGNGTTGYLDTGFNPTTAPTPNWTQNSASLFCYVNAATSNTANNALFTWGNTPNSLRMTPWSGASNVVHRVNNGNSTFSGTITSRIGSQAVSRTASTTTNAQMNGAAFGATDVTASAAVSSANAELLRLAGTIYNGNDRIACAALGGGLSGAEMTALHNRTLTYLTAIGAN